MASRISVQLPTPLVNRWEQVAAGQFGVISRHQAMEELKLSVFKVESLLRRGMWIRVFPQVYRAAAAPEVWQHKLMAAFLWSRNRGVVSGESAAALWELEGYRRPSTVQLCGREDLSPPEGITYRQVKRLRDADVTRKWGVKVTSVARTILDLAALVSPTRLERTLDEALRKGLVKLEDVAWCMKRNGRQGRKGVGLLAKLLKERQGQEAPDSVLETDVAALFRQKRLPTAVKRYRVIERDHFIAEVDLAWPKRKVAVQVHGASFHRQRRNWENDQRVENRLQFCGWKVIKVTWRMLNEVPDDCVEVVASALGLSARPRKVAGGV
jgi:very-short-patch-repair endonuclease